MKGWSTLQRGGEFFQVIVHLPTNQHPCLPNDRQLYHPAEVENKSTEQAVMYSGAANPRSSLFRTAQHSEWQHAMAPVCCS